MLSFNLFIVLAFLLITTQVISAKGFVCPVPNSNKAKQTHAYCTRSITDQEKKDNKIEQCYTVWKAEIGKSSRGRLDCEGVRLGNALATDSYCCEVAGTVGQVIPEGPNMFKNNCTKAL
ncbi:hypothetical protein Pst134EB_010219 [Puccinia striiformis f. sp. tritici]|nr:hypothetical protein Pst134EB_010219 [Puccinia striiformis f. sp. tritici]